MEPMAPSETSVGVSLGPGIHSSSGPSSGSTSGFPSYVTRWPGQPNVRHRYASRLG